MLACSVRPVGSGQKNFQTKAIFASQSETLVIDYHAMLYVNQSWRPKLNFCGRCEARSTLKTRLGSLGSGRKDLKLAHSVKMLLVCTVHSSY